MLSVEDYETMVVCMARLLPVDEVPLAQARRLVLAADLPALTSVPPFTNSAMDGYAVRAADVAAPPVALRVVGDIPAGASSAPSVGVGEAARIMTGAPVPPGADAVVPVEATDQLPGAAPLPAEVTILEAVAIGRHVRRAGESVRVGRVALAAGQTMTPGALAVAASVGYATVPVRRRPRVAVLATGSELVSPGQRLGFGQIPDSNSVLLAGLAAEFGADVVLARAVGDAPEQFSAALSEALAGSDVVVTAGGVSAGAFEPVRQAGLGGVDFVRVAMQPGKPQACGVVEAPDGGRVALLGLPGNPVSVFVSAWVFLRPLLAAMQGRRPDWRRVEARAARPWSSPAGRRQYVPVTLADDGTCTPSHALGSGSHIISALHSADALAVVGEGVERVEVGDRVWVHLVG